MIRVHGVTGPKTEWDKRRVWLENKDCERMTRPEFEISKLLMVLSIKTGNGKKDLEKRLEMIPYGKQRFNMALGGIQAVFNDILGTMTASQARQLQSTLNDNAIQLIPKLAPDSKNVVFERSIAEGLIDLAKERCHGCVEDGESCKKCKLYQILEATTPLPDYLDGLICPYALSDWED